LQVPVVPRFADEPVDLALVDRADDSGEVGIAGEQDAHAVRRNLARGSHRRGLHHRHALITDDHVHFVSGEEIERSVAVSGGENVIATPEQRFQRSQYAPSSSITSRSPF
jgi:hypothetical protein